MWVFYRTHYDPDNKKTPDPIIFSLLRRVQQKINRTQRSLREGSGKEESSALLSSIRSANSGEAGQGTVTGGSDVN